MWLRDFKAIFLVSYLSSYNSLEFRLKDDQGISENEIFTPDSDPIDPSLDWTVGRRGIPYLDWGPHPEVSWIRDQNYGGPYSLKKQVYKREQEGIFNDLSWAGGTANNYLYIRFSEIILWAAEIEIENGNLEVGREYINIIRERARQSEYVKFADGSDAANYLVEIYPTGHIAFSNQVEARKALRMERKLELGMEGHRFFDLVRWGIAVEEINRFLTVESPRRPLVYEGARFSPHNIYYPIPLGQIDLMRGALQQNPGY